MISDKTSPDTDRLTLRPLREDDHHQARRLAERDSAVVPGGALLGAFAGRELVAAVSLGDGRVIADPFRPTAEITGILALRAGQLRAAARGSGRQPPRVRRRRMRLALSLRRARG